MLCTDVFNELKELVYIADMETYELLFANRVLKEKFHIEDCEGQKCYKVLMGRNAPCPFCTNSLLREGQVYEWEILNPKINRHGFLKDMIFEYKGRNARLEIAEDITDEELTNRKLSRALNMEKIAIDCIKYLYRSDTPADSVTYILRQIGELMEADRAYIFEICGNVMNNTYEWCREGVASQLKYCQNMDISLLKLWKGYFDRGENIVVPDVGRMKKDYPDVYEVLTKQDISSLVISPLIINDKLGGYIGVDNPKLEESDNCSILETLCYFFGISIERMQMNERLLRSSHYDALTGLFNRNKFMEDTKKLSGHIDSCMAIVYMDINGLKDINDHLGHQFGDKVLMEGASMLQKIFSGGRHYRVGGDEFVALMEGMSEEELKTRTKQLQNAFLLSADCKGAVGSVWTGSCRDLQKKITAADELMYQDKMDYYRAHPRSKRYRYYNDDTLKLAERSALQQAIKDRQFEIYLQPKVRFSDKKIIGAEALIRYHDDRGQLVMPDQFIPSMEDARTVCFIDFFVFESMCGYICDALKHHYPAVPVSVNFSRYTLMLPSFLNELMNIWKKYGIPKELIEIEIIERADHGNNENITDVIDSVKKAGFPVCIDDFGEKYSNIALFINADLDVLKLDKSVMNDIVTNKKSQLLIGSLAHICHNMDIQLIVEGVETEEQFQVLKDLNCDGAQGYLISKPVPINEFIDLYSKDLLRT